MMLSSRSRDRDLCHVLRGSRGQHRSRNRGASHDRAAADAILQATEKKNAVLAGV
jgi:hypothetical protein